MRTLVLMPCYNERQTLEGVFNRVLKNRDVWQLDVLIIDDSSPDGTGQLADELAAKNAGVHVLHRAGKLGLASAYQAGFAYAKEHGYTHVVEIDADGSHLPEQLPQLLEAAKQGAGLVIGTRWIAGGSVPGWGLPRRTLSKLGTLAAKLSFRSKLHDLTSGYRVIELACLESAGATDLEVDGFGFQIEVAWRLEKAGCKIVEVPITFVEREGGHSKMSTRIAVEALGYVLREGRRVRRHTVN